MDALAAVEDCAVEETQRDLIRIGLVFTVLLTYELAEEAQNIPTEACRVDLA